MSPLLIRFLVPFRNAPGLRSIPAGIELLSFPFRYLGIYVLVCMPFPSETTEVLKFGIHIACCYSVGYLL